MTERERLSELIGISRVCEYTGLCKATDEDIADYLLKNGIIAPPVKVGDTVYEISHRGNIRQRKVVEILIAGEPSFVVGGDIYSEERYHFSLFGKVIFLTKEQAQLAINKE